MHILENQNFSNRVFDFEETAVTVKNSDFHNTRFSRNTTLFFQGCDFRNAYFKGVVLIRDVLSDHHDGRMPKDDFRDARLIARKWKGKIQPAVLMGDFNNCVFSAGWGIKGLKKTLDNAPDDAVVWADHDTRGDGTVFFNNDESLFHGIAVMQGGISL